MNASAPAEGLRNQHRVQGWWNHDAQGAVCHVLELPCCSPLGRPRCTWDNQSEGCTWDGSAHCDIPPPALGAAGPIAGALSACRRTRGERASLMCILLLAHPRPGQLHQLLLADPSSPPLPQPQLSILSLRDGSCCPVAHSRAQPAACRGRAWQAPAAGGLMHYNPVQSVPLPAAQR